MNPKLLVRYGIVPEVARFRNESPDVFMRNERVVINTHRGLELGTILEVLRAPHESSSGNQGDSHDQKVIRRATTEDEAHYVELGTEAQRSFCEWQNRIADWKLSLELIDLEWTLDRQKLVLYVLGGRGPETTKLALYAASSGLAVIEVQPVDANGPVPLSAGGGGCGSGGCGCHADDHSPQVE
jgi:hypothetical protein